MGFYSTHTKEGNPAQFQITKKPEDISSRDDEQSISKSIAYCYGTTCGNPVLLSNENNRISLSWRGGDRIPTFSYEDELEKTWADAQTLVKSTDIQSQHPFMKIMTLFYLNAGNSINH